MHLNTTPSSTWLVMENSLRIAFGDAWWNANGARMQITYAMGLWVAAESLHLNREQIRKHAADIFRDVLPGHPLADFCKTGVPKP